MTIYYPFARSPRTGGDYVNLEHIKALNFLGFDAKVLFLGNENDLSSFGDIPLFSNIEQSVLLSTDDLFVLPETAPNIIKQFDHNGGFSAVPSIIHIQNPFYIFKSFINAQALNAHKAKQIIVPSEYTERRLRETGVTKPIRVIHPYIPDMFRAKIKTRSPIRILYSARKRKIETDIVMYYFRSIYQGKEHVEFYNIANVPRTQVALLMAESPIFASFAERESLGLMALEAMASGCHLVGFSGYSGGFSEYLTEQNGDWIEEGNYLDFAQKLVAAVEKFSLGENNPKIQAGLQIVEDYFRYPSFEEQLKKTFDSISLL